MEAAISTVLHYIGVRIGWYFATKGHLGFVYVCFVLFQGLFGIDLELV